MAQDNPTEKQPEAVESSCNCTAAAPQKCNCGHKLRMIIIGVALLVVIIAIISLCCGCGQEEPPKEPTAREQLDELEKGTNKLLNDGKKLFQSDSEKK